MVNTIWEIRTAREEPQGLKEAEPEISLNIGSNGWVKACSGILAGIILLGIGSDILINGAKSLASSYNWSEEIIGLTIVSAGTSMPELITSLVAAIRGRTDLAIGNVIGSSLLNQLLVLGSCALLSSTKGIHVDKILIQKDFPIMILVTLACMPIFWTKGRISRQEGAWLLSLYVFYLIDQVLPLTQSTLQDEFRLLITCFVLPISLIVIAYKTVRYWTFVKEL